MVPAWVQAVILGVVQGLTEFIPVSSSGHLVLVPYLLGWSPPPLAFDVALHFGTLGAVLIYFRAELAAVGRGLTGRDRSPEGVVYRRVGVLLLVASIPVGIVGLAAEGAVASLFDRPLVVGTLLLVTAATLLLAERTRDARVARAAAAVPAVPADPPAARLPLGTDAADPAGIDLAGLGWRQALAAGVAQMFAVLPGVSRAGVTITGGVVAGLTREAATRFSFLLAIPALVGATLVSLPDLAAADDIGGVELLLGVLSAGLSGYAAIRFLVRLVARDRLTGFAGYCVAVALVTFAGYAWLGPPSTV